MIYKTSMLRSNEITNRSTSTSNLVELISISLLVPIAFSFTNGSLLFAKAAPNNWLLSVDRNILDRATREKACVNSFLLRDRGRCVPIQSVSDFFFFFFLFSFSLELLLAIERLKTPTRMLDRDLLDCFLLECLYRSSSETGSFFTSVVDRSHKLHQLGVVKNMSRYAEEPIAVLIYEMSNNS